MSVSVNFKISGAGGTTFSLDLDPALTLLAVKGLVAEKCSVEPAQMKIIFKGRILKDTDTVEGVQVTSGSNMHVVKSAPSVGAAAAPVASPAAPAASPPPQNPAGLGGMMADPAMMQAAMQMMGGMGGGAPGGGAFGAGGPSPGGMDPAMMQAAMQMMGGMGGGGAAGGMPGMGGGMPGMGGDGMMQMMQNPQVMQQMMQNPMVQQMMQNMSQNPAMLQQMIQNNPMIQQMSQGNPMLQQVLNNPQMLQAMMGGLGAPGAAPQMPAIANGDPAGNALGAPPTNPMMMQQMMQAMQGGMGGGMAGLGGIPDPTDTRPPEERYATQVQQLEGMGFPDRHSNLQALAQSNGDVNQAINCLLGV